MEQFTVKLSDEEGSRVIPQGGLEIPCRLTFEGPRKFTDMFSSKIMRLRSTTDKPTSDDRKETELTAKVVQRFGDVEDEPPSGTLEEHKQSEAITKVVDLTQESKQPKLCCIREDGEASISWEADKSTEWVQIFNFTLKLADKTLLMTGKKLTDMHCPEIVAVPVSIIPRIAQHSGSTAYWILG